MLVIVPCMQPEAGGTHRSAPSLDLARAGVTAREREVLACLVLRLTNREIAERLGCSVRTVESHVSALLGKLGVADRTALARLGPSLVRGGAQAGKRPPRPLTSFVGRGRELGEIGQLLESERLVTLVGAPGVGKTRFAVEFARGRPDGDAGIESEVVFCDLSPLGDGDPVADVVLAVLGASPAPDRTPGEALTELALDHPVLLILDNCEHVARSAADVLGALIAAVPEVRVLATSREPLGVDGEVTYPIHVLGVASPDDPSATSPTSTDAVRLFVDRARAARPGFRLEPGDAEAVAAICRRLDGLPLAIELAAPRLRAFSVRQLEAALDDVLGVLSPDARPETSHSRTLRASIEWSHRTLPPAERLLFRRLSVFAGPAGLDAIETVCSDPQLPRRDVFGLLGSLVDRSLVEVDTRSPGGNRFRLLFPIRSFAAERAAEAGEIDDLGARHAAYYADRAEEAELNLVGPVALEWARRVQADADEVRAALGWSRTSGDVEPGLRIVASLWPVWAYYDRRREWIERVVDLVSIPQNATTAVRARALTAASNLVEAWDVRIAIDFAEQALGIAESIADARAIASANLSLGQVIGRRPGRAEESRQRLDAAYDWFTATGDRRGAAQALFGLGLSEPVSVAIPRWMRARELFVATGDELSAANMLFLAGSRLVREHVDLEDAEAMLLEALERAPLHGSEHEAAHARSALGHLGVVRGEDADARPLLEAVLPWFKAAGDVRCTARCESLLGVSAARSLSPEDALPAFRAAIADAARVDDLITLADCIDGLGSLLPPTHDRTAIVVHAAAAAARDTGRVVANASGADYGPSIRARRRRMGGSAKAAWTEGLALAPLDAASLALSALAPATERQASRQTGK